MLVRPVADLRVLDVLNHGYLRVFPDGAFLAPSRTPEESQRPGMLRGGEIPETAKRSCLFWIRKKRR